MVKPRPVRVIDAETAEHVSYAVVPIRHQREEFLMVTQHAMEHITSEGWPHGDYLVLMKLMSRLDWENFIHVDVKELAGSMGLQRETVSRSIKRLIERGAIHRGPRVGRSYTYRLDPRLGWKGSPAGREKLASKIAQTRWGMDAENAQIDGQLELSDLGDDA